MSDELTLERMANAIMVLAVGTEPGTYVEANFDGMREATLEGLRNKHPLMMEGAKVVQAIVTAYYGAGNLDLEVNVRTVIELVAAGNKAKAFSLAVLDGPGVGRWEMIVRRDRSSEIRPAILLPEQFPKLIR